MCCEVLLYDVVHNLQGMGCDLEHFVVNWDQQCTQDAEAGKGRVF